MKEDKKEMSLFDDMVKEPEFDVNFDDTKLDIPGGKNIKKMGLIKYKNQEIKIKDIENQIIQSTNIEEVKQIEAKVNAIFNYLQKLGRLTIEQANEIKALQLKTEWKIGKLLEEINPNSSSKKKHDTVSLSNLDITPKQSERYQTLAKLEYNDIGKNKEKANEENEKLLKKDLMNKAYEVKKSSNMNKNVEVDQVNQNKASDINEIALNTYNQLVESYIALLDITKNKNNISKDNQEKLNGIVKKINDLIKYLLQQKSIEKDLDPDSIF